MNCHIHRNKDASSHLFLIFAQSHYSHCAPHYVSLKRRDTSDTNGVFICTSRCLMYITGPLHATGHGTMHQCKLSINSGGSKVMLFSYAFEVEKLFVKQNSICS
ncbi:hypothetical protein TRVL_05109 [Trypanosoma vivax]|nr:hypothetical protein TRVL_05109 [Trypanosoma vivax]